MRRYNFLDAEKESGYNMMEGEISGKLGVVEIKRVYHQINSQ